MKELNTFEKQMIIYRINNLVNLQNKDFMASFASIVTDYDLLQNEDHKNLQDHEWCRKTFRHEYTVLKELSKEDKEELTVGRKDNTERQRYYNNIFYVGGRNYMLSSEWYDGKGTKNDNKTKFIDWLKSLVDKRYNINVNNISEFGIDENTTLSQKPFSISSIIQYIKETGLLYTDNLIKRFAFSLMAKRFLILSGLAGSGKTQLALAFANALIEDEKQLCVVSVGADWTNREPLLGFPNALQANEYVKPESGVLDILMEANKEENKNKPYFLILDEMNMSYVERYFADFLSAMESGEGISLWNGESDVPAKISLPQNLFIIGTINVDETTYMFSPKVLDRANVIEFKISPEEMGEFLKEMKTVNRCGINRKAVGMGASFVELAGLKELDKDDEAIQALKEFFDELKKVNAEFGYRTATEIFRYIAQAKKNDDSEKKMTIDEIIDSAIIQKLLPKLHGSRKKLEPVLNQLWKQCFKKEERDVVQIERECIAKAKYKESADKIFRMYEAANANGFTSFAEA